MALNKLKKIKFVIGSLAIGGTEQHIVRILPKLKALGWEVSVLAFSGAGSLAPILKAFEIPVYGLEKKIMMRGIFGKWLRACQSIFWLAKQFKIKTDQDDFILHTFLPASYLFALPAAWFVRHRGPKIMSRRSLNHYQKKYPGIHWVERFFHRSVTQILGNSQAVIDQLKNKEAVPKDKLQLIYNGIDLIPFEKVMNKHSLRQKNKLSENAFLMILVANLIPYKGHADLIKALSFIKNKLPDPWQLICMGRDTGIQSDLEKQAQGFGLSDNIIWLGERQDVPEWLSLSDLGLLCSHEEGFSNAILEGMAAGLPMVVTDVGGNPEAVLHRKTGLVVPARSPTALAAAILDIAQDPQKAKRLGQAGKARVFQQFSLDHCVAQYDALYRGLCVV